MKIIANEVGVFRARYMGFKPCQNAAYTMIKLQFVDFEMQGEIANNLQSQTSNILHDTTNLQIFHGVTEGQVYNFKMSIGYQAPNSRDGKNYPGGVKFKILEILQRKEA